MPETTLIVVPFIVAIFGVFMVALGGAALWSALPDWRAPAREQRPKVEASRDLAKAA